MSLLRSRGQRAPAAWATLTLTLLAVLAIALPATGTAASTATWTASVGAAGANGKATMTAPATAGAAGTLKLALKGLSASTAYPVKIAKGTCAAPGSVLYTGPTQTSTAGGKIAKSLPIPAAKMNAIRLASTLVVRVGTGSKLRCGPFTGGPGPSPTPSPSPTPEPSLAATIGTTATIDEASSGLSCIAASGTDVWAAEILFPEAYKLDPATAKPTADVLFASFLSITLGCAMSEGSLWIATNRLQVPGGAVTRIDMQTKTIPAVVDFTGNALAVSAGAGSIWIAESNPNELLRIDPVKNVVAKAYPLGEVPRGVATGAGSAWLVSAHALFQVDLDTAALTSVPLSGEGLGVAFGDGSVWVTVGASGVSGSAKLLRFDPTTKAVVATLDVPGEPYRISLGSGYAWLSQTASSGKPLAVAVSTASNRVVASVTLPAPLPAVSVSGRSAWYAGTASDRGVIVRIDF
jgi:hypothetical protein